MRDIKGGLKKLGPDPSFDTDEGDSSYLIYSTANPIAPASAATIALPSIPPPLEGARLDSTPVDQDTLRRTTLLLPMQQGHESVRAIEQGQCVVAVQDKGATWLVADWGLGAEGFIGSIHKRRGIQTAPVFRLDLSEFTDRNSFLVQFHAVYGCSFERYCHSLSTVGTASLILDAVPTGIVGGQIRPAELDLEEITSIIRDYCPKLTIWLVCRKRPLHARLPLIELNPLDEAELKAYISASGAADASDPDVVSKLYEFTDGIPSRIDSALKDLEIVSISELIHSNSDIAHQQGAEGVAPPQLVRAIDDLMGSSDPILARAFMLLKALAIFPHGEQLQRIKRFHGAQQFSAVHARALLDRALIETVAAIEVNLRPSESAANRLVVPRPIRTYIRTLAEVAEWKQLNKKAADLYFGTGWATGNVKPQANYRFDKPGRSNSDIINASAIIRRLFIEASSTNNARAMSSAFDIALVYINALQKGHHYRNLVSLCDDIFQLFPDAGYNEKRASLSFRYGKSLRMIGQHGRALELLKSVDDSLFPKSEKQSLKINISMCYQSLDEGEKAIASAKEVISIEPKSSHAIHARTIILDVERPDDRISKLEKLQKTAKKQKAAVVAGNIAITLSRDSGVDRERAREILEGAVKYSAESNDLYNEMRGLVSLAAIRQKSLIPLTSSEQSKLIGAYHFLFNERLPGLFTQAHDVLWNMFLFDGDQKNLLTLFCMSSLYWRLQGEEQREEKYVKSLAQFIGTKISTNPDSIDREVAYFLFRQSALIAPNSE